MRRNGFTLVELMVTVAIVAILMSIATGILVNANKINLKAQAEARLDSSLNRTLEIIKRTVRQAVVDIDPNVMQPSTNPTETSLTVTLVDNNGNPFNITFGYSSANGTIFVDDPSNIIGQNITNARFEVADARRYSDIPIGDNLGVPTGIPEGSDLALYMGGNTLVKITLNAEVRSPGQGTITRTVSDTIITKVGLGQ